MSSDAVSAAAPVSHSASHPAYMPRLDGLRGVAVGLVLFQHFGPQAEASAANAGGVGVRIFFVLSGFLITAILVGYRDCGLGRGAATVLFYWRRFLRLTPALYLAVAVAAVLGVANMRQDWGWAVTYLYNVLVVIRGGFGPAGHLWTLAVEEQFYLVWAVAALFLPRRALIPVTVAFLALGPLYRMGLVLAGTSNFPQVLLPGNIDGLATGAFLALMPRGSWVWRWATSPWLFAAAVAATAALLAVYGPLDWPRRVIHPVCINLASAYAVAVGSQMAAQTSSGRGSRWLAWAPLRWLGRISYGVYVYHYFTPLIAKAWLPAVAALPAVLRAAIYVAVTLVVAELSWRLMERPLRRWRGRVPLLGVREPAAA